MWVDNTNVLLVVVFCCNNGEVQFARQYVTVVPQEHMLMPRLQGTFVDVMYHYIEVSS